MTNILIELEKEWRKIKNHVIKLFFYINKNSLHIVLIIKSDLGIDFKVFLYLYTYVRFFNKY